jgi:hypothetical protein
VSPVGALMRGRTAAAFAAVLVGLSPAGLLACAPWLSAGDWTCASSATPRTTRRLVSRVSVRDVAAGRVTQGVEVGGEPARTAPGEAPGIWRSPSGPAPSTAPPAV